MTHQRGVAGLMGGLITKGAASAENCFLFLPVLYSIRHPRRVIALHGVAFLAAVVLILTVFQPALTSVKTEETTWESIANRLFDNSIQSIAGAEDEGVSDYARFQQLFGSEEFVQLVVSGQGELDRSVFARLSGFVAKLERRGNGANVLWAGRLPHAPDKLKFNQTLNEQDTLILREFLSRLHSDPTASRLLRLPQNRWDIAFYVFPTEELKDDGERIKFTQLVRESWMQSEPLEGWQAELIGAPMLLGELRGALEEALAINFPLVNLIVFLLCWLVARRIRLVFLIYFPLLQCELWLVAAYLVSGHGFNYITSNMATVILVIGAATNIHLLSAYLQARKDLSVRGAIVRAFRHVGRPSLIATATTAVAMISFIVNDDPAIRDFGIYSALGLAAAIFCSYTLLPAALLLWAPREAMPERRVVFIAPFLAIPAWAWSHPRSVLAGAALISLSGIAAIFHLNIGTHVHGYFEDDSSIRKAVAFSQERFSGYLPLEVIIHWPDEGETQPQLSGDELLALAGQLEQTIMNKVRVNGREFTQLEIMTMSDLLDSFCADPARSKQCPDGKPSSQVVDLFSNADMETGLPKYVVARGNRHYLRLTVFHEPAYSAESLQLINRLQEVVQQEVGDSAHVVVTGLPALWFRHDAAMVKNLSQSFIVASIIIFLMMALAYRSVKPLLISIPSNMTPMLFSLGVAGLYCYSFAAQLTSAALMFTTVAVGVIVDDTLYFLLTYQRHIKRGACGETALVRTIEDVGAGIVLTGICLTLGTATLLMGRLIPMQVFGGLLSLTVLAALFADLLLLPAICRVFWNPVK